MGEPIRVLHVLGNLNIGGAESRIMDLYRNCDRNVLQFDFAVHTDKHTHYEEEVKTLGGRIYRLPRFRFWNYFAYKKAWKRLFGEHSEFRAVHGHMTSTAAIYLPVAKKAGIPVTVAHARSAGVDSGLKGRLTKLLRRNLKKKSDYCFACSRLAAEAVFGKEAVKAGRVTILPKTIQGGLYRFDETKRNEMRRSLCVSDRFVIGHVGRFHPCKNHGFLLEVFAAFRKLHPKTVLLLLGEGGQMDVIKKKAETLGILEDVRFLGNQTGIQDYYQAFDAFVFPSFYEGMPGSVVEAQAAGLPCLVSDRVTKEVVFTELVTFLDIEAPAKEWAEQIEKTGRNPDRDVYDKLITAGFDAADQAVFLQKFYASGRLDI